MTNFPVGTRVVVTLRGYRPYQHLPHYIMGRFMTDPETGENFPATEEQEPSFYHINRIDDPNTVNVLLPDGSFTQGVALNINPGGITNENVEEYVAE